MAAVVPIVVMFIILIVIFRLAKWSADKAK